jgi:hypothetical protein
MKIIHLDLIDVRYSSMDNDICKINGISPEVLHGGDSRFNSNQIK